MHEWNVTARSDPVPYSTAVKAITPPETNHIRHCTAHNADQTWFHQYDGFVLLFTLREKKKQQVAPHTTNILYQQCYMSSETSRSGICPDRFNKAERSQTRKHHHQREPHMHATNITVICSPANKLNTLRNRTTNSNNLDVNS